MISTWETDPSVRLRPIPELDCCLAYLPPRRDPPRMAALHGLNLTTWLVLSMCDGRSDDLLTQAYHETMATTYGPGTRPESLAQALVQLERLGLIHRSKREDAV